MSQLQSGKTTVLYSISTTVFDIPADGTITAYVFGAAGGGGNGGGGGYITGTFNVIAGNVLYANVGGVGIQGTGGKNGGGDATGIGFGGGGFSSVGFSASEPYLLIAGGGGGGGFSFSAGGGGGADGAPAQEGAGGGEQGQGGIGYGQGENGTQYGGGYGFNGTDGSSGGGGGYFGGGGASDSGGGGGSSNPDPATYTGGILTNLVTTASINGVSGGFGTPDYVSGAGSTAREAPGEGNGAIVLDYTPTSSNIPFGSTTINFTGTVVEYTIPTDGVITASIYGGAGTGDINPGGEGGFVEGTFDVVAGQTLYANVGGDGLTGYNGGGQPYGGGFSSLGFTMPGPTAKHLLIAGGGGGGGGGGAGGAGGASAGTGEISGSSGASDTLAGGGGGGSFFGGLGGNGGGDGTSFQGGSGTIGGGGGFNGGGGAGGDASLAGGGGGGSSFVNANLVRSIVFDRQSRSGVGPGSMTLNYSASIACLLKGTLVQTPSGDVPIEDITTNSFVNNQHGQPVEVIYTTSRTFSYAAHPGVMYKIPKNARGNTTDLFVTKQHPFFIKGQRKEARDLGFSVAAKEEVVDENGNITVYNISIVDGNTKNLILVNGACEIGTGE
jgi:hypothetical protein